MWLLDLVGDVGLRWPRIRFFGLCPVCYDNVQLSVLPVSSLVVMDEADSTRRIRRGGRNLPMSPLGAALELGAVKHPRSKASYHA